MNRLKLKAFAKINLGLNIVSKRKDGFHNLETFFYPLNNLFDILTFEKSDRFIFTTNNTLLEKEENNLIISAHNLIEIFTQKKLSVKIYLEKNIPIGAGLGGGSSDAAITLLALNKFFNLNITKEQLKNIALQLGSDVPFFLENSSAVGKSRGEILEPSAIKITKPILIVNPGIHISTKEAFENILPKESNFNYNYFLTSEKIDYNYLKKNLTNDFEDFAFNKHPEIKKIKETMYQQNALFSLMSGTGSTVYGIFDNLDKAESCLRNLPNKYFKKIL